MLKEFFTLVILFTLMIVHGQPDSRGLSVISWSRDITLSHTDDKCGEWGGDSETIRIYQKDGHDGLYADYSMRIMNCADPLGHNQRTDYDITESVKITSTDEQLVLKCVLELSQRKLANANYIIHSGIVNSVVLSDSSIVIRDYPSDTWRAFEELKESIKRR